MNIRELRKVYNLTQKSLAEMLECSISTVRRAERGQCSDTFRKRIEGIFSYTVYTDGGCDINPGGNGGYGVVIIDPMGEITELNGGFKCTTNNRMEMMAVLVACRNLPESAKAALYSDSQYVIKTLNGEWQKKTNVDLWHEIDKACRGKDIAFQWIRGHSNNPFNERCDELARDGYMNKAEESDTGYMGPPAAVKSKKRKDVDVPVIKFAGSKTNKFCRKDIVEFYRSGERSFKSYLRIKVHGTDEWSRKSLTELSEIVGNEVVDALHGDNTFKRNVLKWFCRGLLLDDAVRKTMVDDEVSQNAIAGKRRKYE